MWIVLAFLVAPICGYFFAYAPFGIGYFILTAVFGGWLIAYFSAFIFGVPLYFLFKHKHFFMARYFAIGGIICALPFSLWYLAIRIEVWRIYSSSEWIVAADLGEFLHFLGVGLLSGWWFWVIGIWLPSPTLSGAAPKGGRKSFFNIVRGE